MPTAKRTSRAVAQLHTWARVSPLMASIFAPFSVLFDIPALSEPWFIILESDVLRDPNTANAVWPEPTGNITLSALGLSFNIIANALLIVRFSTGAKWWRVATRLSLVSWMVKVVIALINILLYGRGVKPHLERGEGLWCAIISLAICIVITAFLLFHWIMELQIENRGQEQIDDQLSIRIAGRLFMTNVSLFVIDIALLALLSSRVEHWTYLQGIYFSVTTFLTIGYGDFAPTHTAIRIFVFVFAVLGIAQLANIVTMLVGFFDSRAEATRAESRARFEEKRKEEEESKFGLAPHLFQEIEFLLRLGEQQEARIRLQQLTTSLAGLIIFWVIGAAIFSHLEEYTYSTGLYFVYISFLTIGYGDYAPSTPASRVVFVLYMLLAVPIMASFAVQAVQQILYAFSERENNKRKTKLGLKPELTRATTIMTESKMRICGIELGFKSGAQKATRKDVGVSDMRSYSRAVVPHADLAEQWHEEWERRRGEEFSDRNLADIEVNTANERENFNSGEPEEKDEITAATIDKRGQADVQQEKAFDQDILLTEKLLEHAISLEARARKLLITHLDGEEGGKSARIVLKADQNVQMRELKVMLREIRQERGERSEDGNNQDEDMRTDVGTGVDHTTAENDDSVLEKEKHTSRYSRLQSGRTAGIIQRTLQENPNEPISKMVSKGERETLEDVQKYREDFAGLLVAASRLMRLKGDERALFERRRIRELSG